MVCFPILGECLACVSPLPPACCQQEINLLAPLKPLPAHWALNQENCQELGMFPRMMIVIIYCHHGLVKLNFLPIAFHDNHGILDIALPTPS